MTLGSSVHCCKRGAGSGAGGLGSAAWLPAREASKPSLLADSTSLLWPRGSEYKISEEAQHIVQGWTVIPHTSQGDTPELPRAGQSQAWCSSCLGLTWSLCPEGALGLSLHRQPGNTNKSRLSPCPSLFPSLSRTHSCTVGLDWQCCPENKLEA